MADEPGETNETKPPKILIMFDDSGWVPYAHCIETYADLTIKNIAFSTTSVEEAYSWANIILLHKDGLKITLEGCLFELSGWGMIEAPVQNTTLIMDKCHLRNGTVIPSGNEWVPFFFEVVVLPVALAYAAGESYPSVIHAGVSNFFFFFAILKIFQNLI